MPEIIIIILLGVMFFRFDDILVTISNNLEKLVEREEEK